MTQISDIHQQVFDFLIEKYHHNENFFFLLRQLNRNGRLDKGYWFLGNDYYVAISFWMGRDDSTKSPRTSFIINQDGTTYLEILNIKKKESFFTDDLYNKLNITNSNFSLVSKKYYFEFGTDFLSSLKHFIENDKLIIDSFIKNQEAKYSDLLEIGGIDFIYKSDFEKQLNIVYNYQKKRKYNLRKTGYLKNFHITKFGKISNLSIKNIPKDCRWIFLTGENGAGKTSILRALATAISNNNDSGFEVAKGYDDFYIKIDLEKSDKIIETTIKASDDFKNKSKLIEGFAAYGPVRLLNQSSIVGEYLKFAFGGSSDLTTFGLFNPISILKDVNSELSFNVRPKYHEIELDYFLENIERNLEIILPNIHRVSILREGNTRRILYHQTQNPQDSVEFDQLPSGTRNFAALILDLLLRFAEQQEDIVDIADYVGIVLIDEIDLHLHPKMQKEIIIQLSETFPNIQFIVTTHSPIPMLGAPKNSVFINVHKNDENNICAEKLDIDISNLLPNTILTSPIFNFDELINENHSREDRLITEDDYNEAIFYKILKKKIEERSITSQDNDLFTL